MTAAHCNPILPTPPPDLPKEPLRLDGRSLRVEDVVSVAKGRQVRLLDASDPADKETVAQMAASRRWVEQMVSKPGKQVVYGINTGLGPLADVLIEAQQAGELSTNLLVSHAVGVGATLPREVVRAAMLIRANTLARGNSGVRLELVNTLLAMLNAGVHPVVPGWGSVGASGDLAPLSHLALPLLQHDGNDDALTGLAVYEPDWRAGEPSPAPQPGAQAMAAAGIARLRLEAKDGLALNNGTAVSAALLALSLYDAELALAQAVVATGMSLEAVRGYRDALDPRIHAARNHPGQVQVAARLRQLTEGSQLLRSGSSYGTLPHDLPQDAYSLRCAPQVLGAVADTLTHVRDVVARELNAACDNPLIFTDDDDDAVALSGGNFHGQPIAFAADFLSIAACEIASISERRIARLLDPRYSRGLPPMLTHGSGLRSGYMMVQYAAAALVSANKTLAHPDSVDSIPTGANQEDHVSMSTNAAQHARQVADNTINVVASELVCAAQGLDFRRAEGEPGAGVARAHGIIRAYIPHLDAERPPSADVEVAARLIRDGALLVGGLGLITNAPRQGSVGARFTDALTWSVLRRLRQRGSVLSPTQMSAVGWRQWLAAM
ncbi:MAG: histidine ammonia-lyase [Candidatus Chloroheliales bacterium]|nr:MAG: histidine ammonia-lyase [Chloroflexota bacterium]